MATCLINNNELEIILTNDTQNTISVDSAIETYSDVLECKIQSKDIVLEKVDNSVVVLELTINGSKYVTEATLVDDESSFIKINEETLHLVKDNKSDNNVLEESVEEVEESVEEVEEVKVDELTKFLGDKIKDITNQKLTEKVEEIKTFSSNTLYENLETFEGKKKDLLELVEEQFTNVVDGVKSDVNKKLDRFFKRTDLNNKTAIAIETDRLKEEITEKYNSFLAELNNKKKNLEEINGDKVNQLVEDKKEEITNVIKLFVEKIYSEYKEEFNPQLKNIITENKQLNEKIQQLEDIKKDLVYNKVYSEDITRAENNFKKLLKETNKKFNKVNEKLNLISKKDNTRYNSLLAAINDTNTKDYETVLNNKIEQAELGQIKEELEQSITSNMRSEVTSLKRYVEMSAGGGTNAKQYANGGTMNGDLHVTGTVTAGTLLSATQVDFVRETTGFSIDGDLTVDTQTLKVDTTNNRVGIGTPSPGTPLAVVGASTLNGTVKIPTENAAFIKQKCYFKTGGIRLQKGTATTDEVSIRYEGASSNNLVIEQYKDNALKGQIKFKGTQNVLSLDTNGGFVELGRTRTMADFQIGESGVNRKLVFKDSRTQANGLHFEHSGNDKVIQMGRYDSYPSATEGDFKITAKSGSNAVQDILTIDQTTNAITLHKDVELSTGMSIPTFITHTGDSDTAFGFPANNTFQVSTNSQARIKVNPDGNVGIGATSPNEALTVSGNISATNTIASSTGHFADAVGVGTVSPQGKLDVATSTQSDIFNLRIHNINGENAQSTGILFNTGYTSTSRGKGGLVYDYDGTTGWNRGDFHFLQRQDTGSGIARLSDSVLTIKNDGKVGIGTTSPGNKLHIVDTSAGNVTYPIRIQNDNTTNNSGVGIEFGISTDDAYTNARIQATREDSQASAELSFQTKSDSSTNLTERMRIDRNGNVGIGTPAPGKSLHVEFSGDNGVRIESSDNHASLYLDSHSSKGQYIRFSENDTNKYWINSTSGKLIFRPAATATTANQIIFDSAGNVGIGKTPSSAVKLDVNGDIAASGDVTLDQGANRTIKIARVTTGENGNNLTIEAGQFESGTEGNGGSLTLKGGSGDSGDGEGGDLILQPGAGETAGVLQIKGSNFLLDSTSAQSAFRSAIGAGTGTYSNGSIIKTNTIQTHASAILNIYGSSGTTAYPVNITGGSESGDHGSGAGVEIKGGQSGGDSGNGGDVTIQGGSGETTNGKVILGGSNTLQIDVNSSLTASGTVTGNTIVASNMLQADGDVEIDSAQLGINGGDITFSGPAEFTDQAEFQDEVEFQSAAVFSDDIQTSAIQVNGIIEIDSGDGIDFTGGPAPINGAGNIDCQLVTAKGYSLQSSSFTIVSTTSTLAASTNGLTVILQNTGPITITLPTRAAGHVTTFISETIHGVSFVGDTGVTVNSFNGANTTAGQFAQCQVIYKTSTTAFLGGNLV